MSGDADDAHRFSVAELAAWRGFLRAHAVVTGRLEQQIRADAGLSLAEYEVLLKLAVSEAGWLPMARLGGKAYLTLSPSGVSRLVDRLRRRGLVTREAVPDGDRRSAIVRLTDDGRALWRRVSGAHQELVRQIFLAPLDDGQLRELGRAWETVLRDEPPLDDEPDRG